MAKQAKCKNCKIRFVWKKEIPLYLLKCSKCGNSLSCTTHLLQAPVINKQPKWK